MTPLEILESQFDGRVIPDARPADCARCRPPLAGVYLLVLEDTIVYIGSSTDIDARLYVHGRDRNEESGKAFDRALCIVLPISVMDHYEGAFIRALRPRHNRSAPRDCGYDAEILDGFSLDPSYGPWSPSSTTNERATSELSAGIRSCRMAARITQAALADAVGTSKAAVSLWETGVCEPATGKLELIARALGVEISDLYIGATP